MTNEACVYLYSGDRPPKMDNSDIEGEYCGELQKNIVRNHDYIVIPEEAWKKLYAWYGGGPMFKRRRMVDLAKNFMTIELYPPLLICYHCKLRKTSLQVLNLALLSSAQERGDFLRIPQRGDDQLLAESQRSAAEIPQDGPDQRQERREQTLHQRTYVCFTAVQSFLQTSWRRQQLGVA